jgi:hypothetical protein
MRDGVVHDRRADHRADEEREHRLVAMHDHDRLRRRAMVVVHDRRRGGTIVVVVMDHRPMLLVIVVIMSPVAAVGESRGREGCGGEQDGDLLEHLRLLSVLNAYCISRAWDAEVNR